LHSKSPRLLGHYDNMQAYQLYTVMAMAQIPADIVFDQSIERFGLDEYDMLVLPRCDVLTKSVYDRILEFQKRGGVVVADPYLKAEIPNVIRFDFDFTYRDKVTAMAIAKNQKYANWNDQLKPESAELTQVTGVTAQDDQRIMESYARELRQRLDGVIKRDVDCAEPTALLNLAEADGVKYLFVINDKREYGPRLGQYKAVLEKIVPQTVTVDLLNVGDGVCAYDLIDQQELTVKTSDNGRQSIDVRLGELGGKIIALYPAAIGDVAIRAPKQVQAGKSQTISISMSAAAAGAPVPGVQPLKVTITDSAGNVNEYSEYYCAERGALQIALTPAVNEPTGAWTIRVEDLTAGKTAETSFNVVP
jgi:hypothetical protein